MTKLYLYSQGREKVDSHKFICPKCGSKGYTYPSRFSFDDNMWFCYNGDFEFGFREYQKKSGDTK